MPSRGAAALKAASSWPGDSTPSGKPGETLRRTVGLQQPRRHPPEAGRSMGKASPVAPLGRYFLCAIVIPLSGWIATGKPSPLTETAISV